jgi:thioredoxin 1
MVRELSFKELQEEIKSKTVLADFWADWCGPCKQLAPIFEEVSKDFTGKVEFVKISVEHNPDAASLGISSIPCLVFFKDGKEVDRIVGAMPADSLREKVKELLAK